MKLIRADRTNSVFRELEKSWLEQCESYGDSYEEYSTPYIEHARNIANEEIPDRRYGIYALKNNEEFELLAHFNAARLPKTEGRTLRVVWVLLAPKYDYDDIGADVLASLASGLFTATLELAQGLAEPNMQADHVKVHLTGMADRRFFAGFAYALQGSQNLKDVAIRGNWLHMTRAAAETKS
jgi:hypothetical protein